MWEAVAPRLGAMRPSTVPPITRAPSRKRLVTKSRLRKPSGAEEAGAGLSPSWAAPPAIRAFGRVGCANRRSFATGAADAAAAPLAVTRSLTGAAGVRRLTASAGRLPAGLRVADAAFFGAPSPLG